MFRKQDFKKIDLLGSGKKNTKIYKVEHIPTSKIYALKEIEAKNLEKLNEYKEEAVQLAKTQNHVNIVNFFGYYFYETMYNTYRLAIVTEYIDQRNNMEYLFRKKKQKNQYWKEAELEKMIVSLISTFSYLQSIGICHRDIKPANLFLTTNLEIKLIDFGESKDYFLETEEYGEATMATIRGTPQYLSPILWKAHVVDGNTRHAKHNIFKSDVFSCGLVISQIASMEDVTGFNQKNHINDGDKLLERGLGQLRKRYSEHICEIIRLMLRFDEKERPTFVELAKLVLTDSQEPTIDHDNNKSQSPEKSTPTTTTGPKTETETKEESKTGVNTSNKENRSRIISGISGGPGATNPPKKEQQKLIGSNGPPLVLETPQKGKGGLTEANRDLSLPRLTLNQRRGKDEINSYDGTTTANYLTQAELFKTYIDSNQLFVTIADSTHWTEFGGSTLGKLDIMDTDAKWKCIAKYKYDFSSHFLTIAPNESEHGIFLLGPNVVSTTLQLKDNKLIPKAPMLQEKSFFCGLAYNGKIYTFGGYDPVEKMQVKCCEGYDIKGDSWSSTGTLLEARSQASCCVLDKKTMYIFGGYNKNIGTLTSIEKYYITEQIFQMHTLKLPIPLRRFGSVKIAPNKILLLGGIQRLSKESDFVYCVDLEDEPSIERLDRLGKPGALDMPILVDAIGNLHLFLENCSGTSPPFHLLYSFLEYS